MAAAATLEPEPLARVSWATEAVALPPAPTPTPDELEAALADPGRPLAERMVPAFRLAWLRRCERGVPIVLSCLRWNGISVLHLPAEMFVEYQLRAQAMRPGEPVAAAAYGDGGPWYLPTREEYSNGGYEVRMAFCGEGADAILTGAMARLLE